MKASKIRSMFAVVVLLLMTLPVLAADGERGLVRDARPTYPEMAKRMRVSGTVKLGLHITADGSVTKVDVLGGHPLLTQAAVESAKQRKYQAGADETRTVSIEFNMN